MGTHELNTKQRKFVAKYLEHGDATQAYIDAGYKVKDKLTAGACAGRLIKDAKVAQRIGEGLNQIVKASELCVENELRDLQEIKRRCMQKEAVLDNQGNPTGEWKFDSRGALKAIELIGRHLGMWEKEDGKHRRFMRMVSPIDYDAETIIDRILDKRGDTNNAVQITTTSEIPVQSASEDSQTVGERDAELPEFAGTQIPDPQPGS